MSKPISKYPNDTPNFHSEDTWSESKVVCPECKNVRMWQAGWYDGSPENGGACIGTKFKCGECNYTEYE